MAFIKMSSKTEDTEAEYLKRAGLLLKAISRDANRNAIDHPEIIPAWLANQRSNLARASFRLYKAAITHWLECQSTAPTTGIALEQIRALTSEGTKRKGTLTSAKKQKGINEHDLEKLTGWLAASRSAWAMPVAGFLHVGILTGLRPSEWRDAKLEMDPINQRPILVVQNRKTTNGRGNGSVRHLNLEDFTDDDIHKIQALTESVANLQANGFTFEEIYKNCRSLLRNANNSLWPRRPKHITLYSARHQFSSNAKLIHSQQAVAALMGHKSSETATRHYGRRAQGKPGTLVPKPSLSEFNIVEIRPPKSEIQISKNS